MISCPKCGKENQDHYKFCLGCGNELPRDGHGARPFQATPPAGVSAPAAGASAPSGRPAASAAPPGPAAAPFGGAPPGPPGPGFGGAPPGPPGPGFGGAPPGPALGAAGPFGGAPIPASMPAASSAPAAAPFGGAPPGPAPIPSAAPAGPKPAATCPQCGTPNTRGARFCLTCGNDLTAGAAPAPAAAPAAPAAAPFGGGAPAPAQAVGTRPSAARLVLIRPDGSEGGTFQLNEGLTPVGRDAGSLFAGDSYLSPRHATFTVNGQTVNVKDENSLNGVYVRIERQAPIELRDTDIFRIGQEIMRFDLYKPVAPEADGTEKQGAQIEGLIGKISLMIGRETYGNAFPIPVTGLFLGRERGDILFPEDGYVSGLHCQIAVEGGKVMLTDVGSSNGSYIRVRGERTVRNGDLLLIGQQLFRLTM